VSETLQYRKQDGIPSDVSSNATTSVPQHAFIISELLPVLIIAQKADSVGAVMPTPDRPSHEELVKLDIVIDGSQDGRVCRGMFDTKKRSPPWFPRCVVGDALRTRVLGLGRDNSRDCELQNIVHKRCLGSRVAW